MSAIRWILLVVGVIEILGNGMSLLSGQASNGAAVVLLVWVVVVILAAYYQFNPQKVEARKAGIKKTDK